MAGWPYKTNDRNMLLLIVFRFSTWLKHFYFFSSFLSQVHALLLILPYANPSFAHPSDPFIYRWLLRVYLRIFIHIRCSKTFQSMQLSIKFWLGYFFNEVQPKTFYPSTLCWQLFFPLFSFLGIQCFFRKLPFYLCIW